MYNMYSDQHNKMNYKKRSNTINILRLPESATVASNLLTKNAFTCSLLVAIYINEQCFYAFIDTKHYAIILT